MKPRNREINIFNMSLLDVLCGALGTFCFMMIGLFPSYVLSTNKSNAPEVPPGIDPQTFEEAKRRISQLEDALEKYKRYSSDLERQIDQLKRQQKDTNDRMGEFEMRNPILAYSYCQVAPQDELEIWVEDTRVTVDRATGKTKRGPFKADPTKIQGPMFYGDVGFAPKGSKDSHFLVRDTPPGDYKVVLKVINHDVSKGPMLCLEIIQIAGRTEVGPEFNVSGTRVVVPVAIVRVDRDYKQTIQWVVPRELWKDPNWKPDP